MSDTDQPAAVTPAERLASVILRRDLMPQGFEGDAVDCAVLLLDSLADNLADARAAHERIRATCAAAGLTEAEPVDALVERLAARVRAARAVLQLAPRSEHAASVLAILDGTEG